MHCSSYAEINDRWIKYLNKNKSVKEKKISKILYSLEVGDISLSIDLKPINIYVRLIKIHCKIYLAN